MRYIKKLHELAWVENYSIKGFVGFVPDGYKIITDNNGKVLDIVRDFTAEKQLEIIKVIGLLGNVCITKREYNGLWCITTHHKNGMGEHESFDEALAMLIYNIWNYLSEHIQRKIKEVLNDF